MRSVRRQVAFCILLVVVAEGGGRYATGATEFGGMVAGPESLQTNVLESIRAHGGLRWIRGHSSLATQYGFAWLDDVRLYNPRVTPPPESLPNNLLDVFWFCRTNLPPADHTPRALEVWNEADFYFVENNAADMAAVLKAAWWGVKGLRPDTSVLMPSLAFRPSRYALELAHNGLASWTDGLNAHFYGWAADFQPFLAHCKTLARFMDHHGPWWLTEVGYLQLPSTAAMDPWFLARQAAFHERTMIESWAAGIDHHLLFSLTPYVEAGSDMGLTNPNGHWRPAMLSASRLAQRLPGTVPRWHIVHELSGAVIGMVLEEPDQTWWSVFWSPGRPGELSLPGATSIRPAPERLRLRVRWPAQVDEIRAGINGDVVLDPAQLSTLDLTPEHNVHLRTARRRFQIENCRWVRSSRLPRPRLQLAARRELRALPPKREPSPVVLRFRPESPLKPHKPSQTLRLPAETTAIASLEFYNFSEIAIDGEWQLSVPRGWEVRALETGTNASSRSGQSGSFRVPAGDRIELPLRITPIASNDALPARLNASWRGADGTEDHVSIRLMVESTHAEAWHRFGWRDFHPRPEFPAAWQVFETGPGQFSMEIREPTGTQRDAVVFFPVPKGVRAMDRFSTMLRAQAGSAFVQPFLVTRQGEVWRYGEWEPIAAEGITIDAALGDFSPSIWSRHRTFLFPPLNEARWLGLRFQGLASGQVIEVAEPSLRR